MKWVVTDTKYLTKPSKDWQPHIPTANTDTAYIEVRPAALWEVYRPFMRVFDRFEKINTKIRIIMLVCLSVYAVYRRFIL